MKFLVVAVLLGVALAVEPPAPPPMPHFVRYAWESSSTCGGSPDFWSPMPGLMDNECQLYGDVYVWVNCSLNPENATVVTQLKVFNDTNCTEEINNAAGDGCMEIEAMESMRVKCYPHPKMVGPDEVAVVMYEGDCMEAMAEAPDEIEVVKTGVCLMGSVNECGNYSQFWCNETAMEITLSTYENQTCNETACNTWTNTTLMCHTSPEGNAMEFCCGGSCPDFWMQMPPPPPPPGPGPSPAPAPAPGPMTTPPPPPGPTGNGTTTGSTTSSSTTGSTTSSTTSFDESAGSLVLPGVVALVSAVVLGA